jgi:uncharacterized sulfatase
MRQLARLCFVSILLGGLAPAQDVRRPNILLAVADDQCWLHVSALGCPFVRTPHFDRVARAGVLFKNCFVGSPICSPSRAALLTGLHHWQLAEAGTHSSSFPTRFPTYPQLLEGAGYSVGATGKGWGPGNHAVSGWKQNPAGPGFDRITGAPPTTGISTIDYASNFSEFLSTRPKDRPFCFWYGAREPHRPYEPGSGLKAGKRPQDVVVPPFLPDTPEVRSDLLDYAFEIEWFDRHLGRILEALEKAGELENTLVLVTGDNGMPFPHAKANLYEYGVHVPLAVSWPRRVPAGRTVEDLVGFVDLTATILEAAGVRHPGPVAMSGRSLLDVLTSDRSGLVDPTRDKIFVGRERASCSRPDNLGYPSRAIRTPQYLYIRNFHPERWPAGDPQILGKDGSLSDPHGAYFDIDHGPTLDVLVAQRARPEIRKFLLLAADKRPAEELFEIRSDPGCLLNLAADPSAADARARLAQALEKTLRETQDPRMGPTPDVWESYPRYGEMRRFPASPEHLPE